LDWDNRIEPTNLYSYLENWWGVELNEESSEKIALAPDEQLIAFAESMLEFRLVDTEIAPGCLRAALGNSLADHGIDQSLHRF
jgi:hypothetical protein